MVSQSLHFFDARNASSSLLYFSPRSARDVVFDIEVELSDVHIATYSLSVSMRVCSFSMNDSFVELASVKL